MTFATWAALAVGLLVAVPIAAHLLRRRRAGIVELPTARLLATSPPNARRRSALEDRSLFSIRALAILGLALLGASPFVSCSHLTLARKGGGSVALVFVIDDSLSMRAPIKDGPPRFDRAKQAALELAGAARDGDSIAIVLAGSEPRVALASTTDTDTAKAALAALEAGDRGTDLPGALAIARDLVKNAPQRDRRVVLLSDLADGHSDAPPLSLDGAMLWYPAPELTAASDGDCAIVLAQRTGQRVTVRIVCSPGATAQGRTLDIETEKGSAAKTVVGEDSEAVVIDVPEGADGDLDARLSEGDAISSDDYAPVTEESHDLSIAVVSDTSLTHVETGGPPPVEQALAALDLGRWVHALPSVPDHEEELSKHAGLILDDPPGLTPEERRAVASWVEGGGTLLLALGKRAAEAPLGAGFGSLVPGVVRFRTEPPSGADVTKCGFFGQSAESLAELAPKGRVTLDHDAMDGAELLCSFSDGEPLLVRRVIGRGAVLIVTLPFDLETSDLVLRPAFLSLLDRFAEGARMRGGPRVVEVGQPLVVPGATKLDAKFLSALDKDPEDVTIERHPDALRVPTQRIGRYVLSIDGASDVRAALAPPTEIDLRPRGIAPTALDTSLGGKADQLDAAPYVALGLLGLLVAELALRLWLGRKDEKPAVTRG